MAFSRTMMGTCFLVPSAVIFLEVFVRSKILSFGANMWRKSTLSSSPTLARWFCLVFHSSLEFFSNKRFCFLPTLTSILMWTFRHCFQPFSGKQQTYTDGNADVFFVKLVSSDRFLWTCVKSERKLSGVSSKNCMRPVWITRSYGLFPLQGAVPGH